MCANTEKVYTCMDERVVYIQINSIALFQTQQSKYSRAYIPKAMHLATVADRGVSGSWGPLLCGALCQNIACRAPSGVFCIEKIYVHIITDCFVTRAERDIGFGGYRQFHSGIEDDEAVVKTRRNRRLLYLRHWITG